MSRPGASLAVRLLSEFAIIFVGLVLAFQFENWRESRVDAERAEEALAALAADFEVNLRRLDETRIQQQRTVDAIHVWLRATSGLDAGASPDSLGWIFPTAISWYAEETVSGAWDALTSSGDLGLLRDAELRGRLAEFYGWIDTGFEDHDNEMDILALLIDRTAGEVGPLLTPEGRLIRLSDRTMERPATAPGVAALVAIPELRGLLAWKTMVAENRLARLDWLRAQADTISTQIAELRAEGS